MVTPTGEQETQFLSGGTQQKVVVGKWLSSDSNVYIFNEPSKGIDIGGKHDIYQMIVDLAKSGAGVIFISNELDEVLSLCDRILIMFSGRIVKEVLNEDKEGCFRDSHLVILKTRGVRLGYLYTMENGDLICQSLEYMDEVVKDYQSPEKVQIHDVH